MRKVLIEKTSKRTKGKMLFGIAAVIVGVVCTITQSSPDFLIVSAIGVIFIVFARLEQWWEHE